jgi:hypothetical protein
VVPFSRYGPHGISMSPSVTSWKMQPRPTRAGDHRHRVAERLSAAAAARAASHVRHGHTCDLQTIYDISPLYGSSGHGQTIVVVEDTDLHSPNDWQVFRQTFGPDKQFPQDSLGESQLVDCRASTTDSSPCGGRHDRCGTATRHSLRPSAPAGRGF